MKTQLLESGERICKNEVEWTRKVKIEQEESPGSGQSMHGYILTYSRL